MKIHLLSDLHNEFGQPYGPVVRDADVTILAGDIDIRCRGVQWAEHTFSGHVLYVPGNHEYYGEHFERTFAKMQALASERVRVLDRDVCVIGGVRFLGATGWTRLDATGNLPLAAWDAQQRMQDYKKIRCAPGFRKWRPEHCAREAHETFKWLFSELSKPFGGRTVVITHHAPSVLSLDGHGDHLDASYANRWESLFGEGLDLWVHGHTHRSVDYMLEGTRVVSNPRGYPGENVEGFDPELILDV